MIGSTLIACACVLAVQARAGALPPPDPGVDEAEAKLMIRCAMEMWPAQPPFKDSIALESPNAVGRYAALWPSIGEDARRAGGAARLSSERFEVSDPDIAGITTNEYRTLLEGLQPQIALVIAASKVKRFETYELGRPAMQPLAENDPRRDINKCVRVCARLLRDDAVRCWTDGHRDEAAARVGAIIRMGGQRVRGDVWMIDALVADSIQQLGLAAARCLLDDAAHPMSPIARTELREAIDALDPQDPGAQRKAWRRTFEVNLAFVNEELEGGEVGQDLQMDLASLHGGVQVMRNLTNSLLPGLKSGPKRDAAGDPIKDAMDHAIAESPAWVRSISKWNTLRAKTDQAAKMHADAEAVWELPDGAEKLRPMDEAAEADETGLIMTIVGFPRQMQKSWRKGVDAVRELRDRLRPGE
jgi:hypothetical protein